MLIVCPSCATAYNVEPESLGPEGRQVRCVRCRSVWQAERSHADKLLAAAAAIGPDPGVGAEAPLPSARGLDPQPGVGPAAAASGEIAPADAATAAADPPPGDAHGTDDPSTDDQAVPVPAELGDSAPAAAEDQAAAEAQPDEAVEVDAPPIAPVDLDEGQPPIDIGADHRADIESIAARRRQRPGVKRPKTRWPLSRLQTAIVALLFVDCLLVGWRSDFVRILPQTASFYASIGLPVNLRGLAFDGVITAAEQHEGVPILVVEGNVINDAHKIVEVPRLKFIIRNAARQEIYSWTAVPSRNALPPGEAVAFRTRLASPPPDARDVLVRFVTRRDMIGAVR